MHTMASATHAADLVGTVWSLLLLLALSSFAGAQQAQCGSLAQFFGLATLCGTALGPTKSVKTEHGSTNADVLHTDGLMTKKTPLNQASHGTGEAWPGAGCWVFLKP